MGIRSFLSKVTRRKRAPTLERAAAASASGRQAEAAVLFRALAERGDTQAQLRVAQLYERCEGLLQSLIE